MTQIALCQPFQLHLIVYKWPVPFHLTLERSVAGHIYFPALNFWHNFALWLTRGVRWLWALNKKTCLLACFCLFIFYSDRILDFEDRDTSVKVSIIFGESDKDTLLKHNAAHTVQEQSRAERRIKKYLCVFCRDCHTSEWQQGAGKNLDLSSESKRQNS